jgi:hypothetical protein
MIIKSEYIGIRVAMVDALQRVGNVSADFPEEVVAKLQRAIREACRDNRMIGDRREAIGEAWAMFLATRSPKAILEFVNHPDVVHAIDTMPLLVNDAHHITPSRALKLYQFNSKFERIAQDTGLIDYKQGETLQKHLMGQLAQIEAQQVLPEAHRESPSLVGRIHDAFNSEFGSVQPADLHMTDSEMDIALKRPDLLPKPSPRGR